ncbi:hypothetical protein [Rhodobacter maris]|uniref:Uncharacterized protein n=1 Tax=Rhodobacter maris TaxID=446682 RepID=A0A285S008_9RHOB|nr:hypothetical protein [Rhodobacter maris]SOC00133.1 hypothetical protein SAMN05877831_102293 [Rhodobacter maris]
MPQNTMTASPEEIAAHEGSAANDPDAESLSSLPPSVTRLLDLAAVLGIDPERLLAQFEALWGDPEADVLAEAAVVARAVHGLIGACVSADRIAKAAAVAKAFADMWAEAQDRAPGFVHG